MAATPLYGAASVRSVKDGRPLVGACHRRGGRGGGGGGGRGGAGGRRCPILIARQPHGRTRHREGSARHAAVRRAVGEVGKRRPAAGRDLPLERRRGGGAAGGGGDRGVPPSGDGRTGRVGGKGRSRRDGKRGSRRGGGTGAVG